MGRKLAAVLLALMLCAPALAEARYIVAAGGMAALVDARGDVILSGDGMTALFEVRPGALYAAGVPGDYGLYDADGAPLSAERFQMIDDMGDALIFRQNGRYGAMDASGALTQAPAWTQLVSDGAGGFLALDANPLDEQPDEVIHIDGSSLITATGSYTDSGLKPLRSGRMAFRAADGRFGYLDSWGSPVIPAEWAWAGDFQDGAAIVSDGALYGLIDPEGNLLAELRYTWLQRGEGLVVGLLEDGTAELRSPDGRAVTGALPAPIDEISPVGRYVAVTGGGRVTLYDSQGRSRYSTAPGALFFPGLDGQVILSEGDWGEACQRLLGPEGAVSQARQRILPLIPGRYACLAFDENYANLRCGLLDGRGATLREADCLNIFPAGSDRLVLVTDGAVIFADADGQPLKTWDIRE